MFKTKKKTTTLEGEADRLFSLLVRQEAANEIGIVRCCTCGSWHHWRKIQNGHFMSRRYQCTRYDKKNTGPQCVYCNIFSQGRQFEFAQYLNKKYGNFTSDEMEVKSKMTCQRKEFDYKYMIQEFKAELKLKNYEIR